MPVAIDDVIIPALHLDLGIFQWFFDAMLTDLRALDSAMAQRLGQTGTHHSDSQLFGEAARLSSELGGKEKILRKPRLKHNLLLHR